jgi:hypothetical protein
MVNVASAHNAGNDPDHSRKIIVKGLRQYFRDQMSKRRRILDG